MARKFDSRIRIMIENSVITGHRSLFIIVGENGLDNVVTLYEILSKADNKARPPVLWCYKNLEFFTNRNKRQKLMNESAKKKQTDAEKEDSADPLQRFIASAHIKYCSYSDTDCVVGRTCGMAILQNFEALTPNLLARIVETVAGGGMIIILLQTIKYIDQLYTLAMDVHAHYRTEACQDIVYKFNERFVLSLPTCRDCLVLNDELKVVCTLNQFYPLPIVKPLSPESKNGKKSPEEEKFIKLKKSLDPTEPVDHLVELCKTFDQGNAVLRFIDVLCEKSLHTTVVLKSSRGRGKSAALGFAVAAAVDLRYTNIVIVAPHPESVRTVFEFLAKGLNRLGYKKYSDYEEIKSSEPKDSNAVVQVIIKKHLHAQIVRYEPLCGKKLDLSQVKLIVIDEAAAIPLPYIQDLLGPYIVFIASTVNGYEATGRSLSLKLFKQLRQQTACRDSSVRASQKNYTGRVLHEISLNESIRYRNGDQVEAWLNRLLCLDITIPTPNLTEFPAASECKLYYVNRGILFSHTKSSERFLRRMVSILMASQCKSSPDDLLVMADAPAHQIFCLCAQTSKELPEILCVLHVCYEGKLAESTLRKELIKERQENGDHLPWAIVNESTEELFELSGARIVRIATHPECQKKGYGSHAVKLLQEFYEGKFITDRKGPRIILQELLYELDQIKPKVVDYLAVSYGITPDLLRFWKKAGFCPAYLAHMTNLNGDHTCIMLKQLTGLTTSSTWINTFWKDFYGNMINCYLQFNQFPAEVALELISYPSMPTLYKDLSKIEISNFLRPLHIEVLRDVCHTDTHYPPDFDVTPLAKLYFSYQLPPVSLEKNERIILFALGVLRQFRPYVCKRLNMDAKQVQASLQKAFVKVARVILHIVDQ